MDAQLHQNIIDLLLVIPLNLTSNQLYKLHIKSHLSYIVEVRQKTLDF